MLPGPRPVGRGISTPPRICCRPIPVTLFAVCLPFPRWWLGFFCGALAGMAAELPRGRVLEKVECAADSKQSYALYVPTKFNPKVRWPVLFCFDPGARGRVPVERFAAAAEKFGYIVAGSNNSRNGPWPANVAAIDAMIRDVDGFFPLDQKRVYVAGLSGGARVACQVAMNGLAQGVVACSAAFPDGTTPDKVSFAVFGTAGVTDFNYLELRRVDRELDERRVMHRVVIHDGGHEWLSSELAVQALAWFDLQAMRAGTLPRDPARIEAEFALRRDGAPAAPAPARFAALKSLAADFKGLTDTAVLEKEVTQLAASRDVRNAIKADRAAERREETLVTDLLTSVRDGFASDVKKTAAQLRTKAEGSSPEREMAGRVLQAVYTNCSENVRDMLRSGEYAPAEPVLEMMILLRPERPQPYFDLARCRARRGDKKRALVALEQAVAAGLGERARVQQEPAFESLKSDPAFVKLVDAIKDGPSRGGRR